MISFIQSVYGEHSNLPQSLDASCLQSPHVNEHFENKTQNPGVKILKFLLYLM